MKTIQTKPDCTLGFVELEYPTNSVVIEGMKNPIQGEFGTIDKTYLPFTPDMKEVFGKLSEITEDQAKELVEKINTCYKAYRFKGSDWSLRPIYKGEGQEVRYLRAIHSLQSAAQSAGIEEKDFDSYLVIKL